MMNPNTNHQLSKYPPVTLRPIGYVKRDESDDALSGDELRARPARIVLDPALTDGLMGLGPGSDVVVLFCFDRSAGFDLQLHPRGDPNRELRGVFATRSPRRPNPIASTTVRILSVEANVLEVVGLDALDSSPVLDIKVHSSYFDAPYG